MVAIGSAAHMGSANTPKRGYSGQHSRRAVWCQSEVDRPGCVSWGGATPFGGRALVLRTEPRSTGSSALAGFDPCRGARQRTLKTLHRSAQPPSHEASPASGGPERRLHQLPRTPRRGVERRAGDPHERANLLHGALPRPVELDRVATLVPRRAACDGRRPPPRAASRPARIRSRISARSNSASAPKMWNTS